MALSEKKQQNGELSTEEALKLVKEGVNYNGVEEAILILGHVRSATTAMLRMGVASGRPGFYQPVKARLRQLMSGQKILNQLNLLAEADHIVQQYSGLKNANPRHIIVKETVGVKKPIESDLPYFQLHRELANSADTNLRVLLTARHPASAYASCMKTYGEALNDDQLLNELFIRSQLAFYQQVEQVQQSGLDHVLVAHGLLDTSAKYPAYSEDLARKIFACLDVQIADGTLSLTQNWASLSPEEGYKPASSGIYFPQEPGMNELNEKAHARVMGSTGLGIGQEDVNGATLEIEGYKSESAEISRRYGNFYEESSKQLGFG
ncbi:MAG: hypothetical protein Q8P72_05960 [Candidatus Roizmanbacteria bacterium]|nr:hypothetical protein [Candidatus Roizmanbacteria bacterium]